MFWMGTVDPYWMQISLQYLQFSLNNLAGVVHSWGEKWVWVGQAGQWALIYVPLPASCVAIRTPEPQFPHFHIHHDITSKIFCLYNWWCIPTMYFPWEEIHFKTYILICKQHLFFFILIISLWCMQVFHKSRFPGFGEPLPIIISFID